MVTGPRLVTVQRTFDTSKRSDPYKRRSNEQSVQIEDLANDMQYLLQAFTGIEDRLTKLETSACLEGNDIIYLLFFGV